MYLQSAPFNLVPLVNSSETIYFQLSPKDSLIDI